MEKNTKRPKDITKFTIDISYINLIYRDDTLFRFYVLVNDRFDDYDEFCKLPSNRKNNLKKLLQMYKSVDKIGQRKSIKVVEINKKFYPISGSHRIACLLALGKNKIKIKICDHSSKWNDDKGLSTHHFLGLPKKVIKEFEIFREEYYGNR